MGDKKTVVKKLELSREELAEIADELNQPEARVSCVAENSLEASSHEERRVRKRLILNCAKRHWTIKDIAAFTSLSQVYVRQIISSMRSRKILPRVRPGPKPGTRPNTSPFANLDGARTKTFIHMTRERYTLDHIGKRFSLTRERVRQLQINIKRWHGEDIFSSGVQYYTLSEAAKELNLSYHQIKHGCKTGRIPTVRKGERIVIDEIYLSYIEDSLTAGCHSRPCAICSKMFKPSSHKVVTCSSPCKKKEKISVAIPSPFPTPK